MGRQTFFLSPGCLTELTRADRFLDEMNRVVPWTELVTEAIFARGWYLIQARPAKTARFSGTP
jgi:hypothetical protein